MSTCRIYHAARLCRWKKDFLYCIWLFCACACFKKLLRRKELTNWLPSCQLPSLTYLEKKASQPTSQSSRSAPPQITFFQRSFFASKHSTMALTNSGQPGKFFSCHSCKVLVYTVTSSWRVGWAGAFTICKISSADNGRWRIHLSPSWVSLYKWFWKTASPAFNSKDFGCKTSAVGTGGCPAAFGIPGARASGLGCSAGANLADEAAGMPGWLGADVKLMGMIVGSTTWTLANFPPPAEDWLAVAVLPMGKIVGSTTWALLLFAGTVFGSSTLTSGAAGTSSQASAAALHL